MLPARAIRFGNLKVLNYAFRLNFHQLRVTVRPQPESRCHSHGTSDGLRLGWPREDSAPAAPGYGAYRWAGLPVTHVVLSESASGTLPCLELNSGLAARQSESIMDLGAGGVQRDRQAGKARKTGWTG